LFHAIADFKQFVFANINTSNFAAGVNDTGGKFATGNNDTGTTGIVDTSDAP
jgi:hypothetical protein